MLDLSRIKTIVFDWDGTLHDSFVIYKPALLETYQVLVDEGLAIERILTDEEIKSFIGLSPKEMWASFSPKLSDEAISKASAIISDRMIESIKSGNAKLYPGTLELLKYLKEKGYRLIYLSNSKLYYMNAMDEAFDLCRYFDMMLCSEMYSYLSKKYILERVIHQLPKDVMMIGDRKIDIETGKYNKTFTMGVSYGFGSLSEIEDADLIADSIDHIKHFL